MMWTCIACGTWYLYEHELREHQGNCEALARRLAYLRVVRAPNRVYVQGQYEAHALYD